jgi:drug/metabolite transporter (DMT)-like permease
MRKTMSLGAMLAFVCLFILGVMPIISNSRPHDFDALGFAFFLSAWQLLFSLPLLLGELASNDRGIFEAKLPTGLKRRTIAIILATGVIFGLSTYVYVLAMEKAGAISAAIAIQAYPLFAILWETVFLNRRKSPVELFFTFLLLATLYFLATNGTWRISGFSPWFALALAIPFLWSVAHVIIKQVLDNTPITPGQVTFFRVLVSTVFLLGVATLTSGPGNLLRSAGIFEFQRIAILMGLVYYLELICWFYAVRHIDVSLASSITVPAPALTMVLAVVFLRESLETYQLIAIGMVIISIYGLLLAGKKRSWSAAR